MSRLLVTGGAGFIGANFVRYWLERHPDDRILVLDALTYAGKLSSLTDVSNSPKFQFVHGDICETSVVEDLLRQEKLDTVVHFAAESHVDRSITGPDAFIQSNVVGTHSLLKAARTVWLEEGAVPFHRFHHVSTDEVYGSLTSDGAPFTENTAFAPNSPYSASKAASDFLVRAYNRTYGLQTTISNCSNNYGPYQLPDKLIPVVIRCILDGNPIPVYGDGMNVRDWIHVEDHCKGIDQILCRGSPGEQYNLGGSMEIENILLVRRLCEIGSQLLPERLSKCDRLIEFVKDRPGHDRRYAIDSSKARCRVGFAPTNNFDQRLRETFAWYVGNEWWWRG